MDLDQVFRPGDPGEMADRLEVWQREFSRQVEGFDKVQRAAADLRVTEIAVDGGLAVTVDVSGQVVDITTTDELEQLSNAEIGPAVLACIRRAQESLAAKFAETAKDTLGEDPLGAQLTEQFRQRFPQQEEPAKPKPRPVDEDGQPVVWDES